MVCSSKRELTMRIYLAKSNKANPDYLIKIRHFLNEFKNVKTLEYRGGSNYDSSDLISSDLLIVIPDLSNGVEDNKIVLGKGLYTQIEDFIDYQCADYVLIVSGINKDGEIMVRNISEEDDNGDYDGDFLKILDTGDYINFGTVRVDKFKDDSLLTKIVAELILLEDDNSKYHSDEESEALWSKHVNRDSILTSTYKYLLIKK